MFGMPYFEDNLLIGEFESYQQAVAAIEKKSVIIRNLQQSICPGTAGKRSKTLWDCS